MAKRELRRHQQSELGSAAAGISSTAVSFSIIWVLQKIGGSSVSSASSAAISTAAQVPFSKCSSPYAFMPPSTSQLAAALFSTRRTTTVTTVPQSPRTGGSSV